MVGYVIKMGLCVLLGLALFGNGAKGLYTYATNRTPKEITCAEYIASPPAAEWLTLTECTPRLDDLAYNEWVDDVDEVYIPVDGADGETQIKLVVVTEELEWLQHADRIRHLTTETAIEEYFTKHGLGRPQTFTGSIQTTDDDRDKLREVLDNVSSSATLVEHNEKPDWAFGLAFTLLGLGLVGFGVSRTVSRFRRRRRIMKATAI